MVPFGFKTVFRIAMLNHDKELVAKTSPWLWAAVQTRRLGIHPIMEAIPGFQHPVYVWGLDLPYSVVNMDPSDLDFHAVMTKCPSGAEQEP